MLIEVVPDFTYGKVRYYPDNKLSEALLKITKRKSFTKKQLYILQDAGFLIDIANPRNKKMYSLEES